MAPVDNNGLEPLEGLRWQREWAVDAREFAKERAETAAEMRRVVAVMRKDAEAARERAARLLGRSDLTCGRWWEADPGTPELSPMIVCASPCCWVAAHGRMLRSLRPRQREHSWISSGGYWLH